MKTYYLAASFFLLSSAGIFAEGSPALSGSDFHVILRQSDGNITGLNVAMGRGENVAFFSNLDQLGVEWDESSGPVMRGSIDSAGKPVVLGVCAGGRCESSVGMSLTTPMEH